MSVCPKRYPTPDTAEAAAGRLITRTGRLYVAARCPACGKWHVRESRQVAPPARQHARHSRNTPPRAATEAAWLRDGGRCVGCGVLITDGMWWSMQHRIRRHAGGHQPSNLILLCGSATSRGCHRLAENRDADARRRGLWLPANTIPPVDPATVPVWYASDEAWFLLDDDGGRARCPAPEAVAS